MVAGNVGWWQGEIGERSNTGLQWAVGGEMSTGTNDTVIWMNYFCFHASHVNPHGRRPAGERQDRTSSTFANQRQLLCLLIRMEFQPKQWFGQ